MEGRTWPKTQYVVYKYFARMKGSGEHRGNVLLHIFRIFGGLRSDVGSRKRKWTSGTAEKRIEELLWSMDARWQHVKKCWECDLLCLTVFVERRLTKPDWQIPTCNKISAFPVKFVQSINQLTSQSITPPNYYLYIIYDIYLHYIT